MKHYFSLFLFLAGLLLATTSCSDNEHPEEYLTHEVVVQLVYPADSDEDPQSGVAVKLYNSSNSNVYDATTDDDGKAHFNVPAGIYDASAGDTRQGGGKTLIYNGTKSNVTVTAAWNPAEIVLLDLVVSQSGSIIIKELYVGGCPTDDGSGVYTRDQYVILYNNSVADIELGQLALGLINPYNGHATNNDYVDDALFYEKEGWIPAGSGVWTFVDNPTLKPGEQIVVALNNAIDNTVTYSNSVSFANADYYATYDPASGFNNTNYYSVPAAEIPAAHYLKAYRISLGNAWVLSQLSPAFFIFMPEDTTIDNFINDPSTDNLYGSNQNRKKVPAEWVVDGVEVFKGDSDANKKRLTSVIDAGYVYFMNQRGYTLYRNVDKEATEALVDNAGKVVYNYTLGTDSQANGSTDPSGIDAEASIRNGARIVYKDTNNSTADFHQRSRSSLRN